MGSVGDDHPGPNKGQKAVVDLYVTGFGKFQGVAENPTTFLVESLEGYLKERPLDEDVRSHVRSLTLDVLETSAEGSLEVLERRFNSKVRHPPGLTRAYRGSSLLLGGCSERTLCTIR